MINPAQVNNTIIPSTILAIIISQYKNVEMNNINNKIDAIIGNHLSSHFFIFNDVNYLSFYMV